MQAMVISGSMALVQRGVIKHDEAVIHSRCLTQYLYKYFTNTLFVQKHLFKDLETLLANVPCSGIFRQP